MAASVEPLVTSPQASCRMLGESVAVVSSGAWFSAVTSAAFADAASEAHEAGATGLVLDLTSVRALDSAGTATLAGLVEQLDDQLVDVAIAASHPGLVAWLADVSLDEVAVHDTVEDGLADVLRRPL